MAPMGENLTGRPRDASLLGTAEGLLEPGHLSRWATWDMPLPTCHTMRQQIQQYDLILKERLQLTNNIAIILIYI